MMWSKIRAGFIAKLACFCLSSFLKLKLNIKYLMEFHIFNEIERYKQLIIISSYKNWNTKTKLLADT